MQLLYVLDTIELLNKYNWGDVENRLSKLKHTKTDDVGIFYRYIMNTIKKYINIFFL